jgi:hypothetical protein
MAKQKNQWHNGCATLTKCSSLYFASFHVQIDNEKYAKSTFKPFTFESCHQVVANFHILLGFENTQVF